MQPPFPEFTRAEAQVRQLLWQRGPSYVKDLCKALPTRTTLSASVRILEQRAFVG